MLATSVLVAQQNTTVPQPRAGALPAPATASPKPSRAVSRPEGMSPKAANGFTVTMAADLRAPRMMVYAPNGDLFVSSPGANNITVLRDANNDGVFESQSVYAQGAPPAPRGGGPPPNPAGGQRAGGQGRAAGPPPGPGRGAPPVLGAEAPACTPPPDFAVKGPGTLAAPFGLAFHDGYLYVGNTASLVRYKYTNGDLQAQGEPEKLLDLPNGGHSTRNIIFNRAGTKMYIAVGSQSNNDAGEDCRRAAILEFNPDGTGYRVYASGIRNPVGLALQPGTDIIWTAMNERDNLGDDLVPDYATSVKDGGFYGWPYSYIGENYDPRYIGSFPDLVKRTHRSGRAAAGACGGARHHVLHRQPVPAALPQWRVRRAAWIVESIGRVGLQGGVLPDGQRQAGTDRRLPDWLPGERWSERHVDRSVGSAGWRDRRARRLAARV